MTQIPRMIAAMIITAAATQTSAHAQAVIGDAARVINDVTGTLGGRRAAIVTGVAVHQNETVSTGRAASADLRFLDNTNLSVSPGSSVKLDRYVYNPDGSARGAVVSMTRGTFRFATGQSDPAAFRLQTPQAIIGIRGTVLEIDVERGVTHVTLLQGAIDVCPRSNRRNCATLTRPGSSISVTQSRVLDDGDDLRQPVAPPIYNPPINPGGGFWFGPAPFPGLGGGRPGRDGPGRDGPGRGGGRGNRG